MTREEFNSIKDQLSQIIDDIAGNPDWYEAARALASDIGTIERNVEKMVVTIPSDVDKTAEEYAKNRAKDPEQCYEYLYYELIDAVRFGAEWMAGQGYSKTEGVFSFNGLSDFSSVVPMISLPKEFEPGDKVRIQITKVE